MLDPRSEEFPRGWYLVAHAHELPPHKIVPMKAFGRDVILLRDEDGKPHLVSRHCPHRGADLTLGQVKGSTVECALHRRCFALAPRSRTTRQLDAWPCTEKNQSIFAWYSPSGGEPTWELDTLLTGADYHPWLGTVGVVKATVEDFSEGAVDFEHFSCIHGEVVESFEMSTKDHKLFANYTMRLDHGYLRGMRYSVQLTSHGPALTYGYAQVHMPLAPAIWINVGKVPIDKDNLQVWGCVATPRRVLSRDNALGRVMGPVLDLVLAPIFRQFAHQRFQKTYQEDVTFFKDRVWVDSASVVGNNEGDRIVRQHAAWFSQFLEPPAPLVSLVHGSSRARA